MNLSRLAKLFQKYTSAQPSNHLDNNKQDQGWYHSSNFSKISHITMIEGLPDNQRQMIILEGIKIENLKMIIIRIGILVREQVTEVVYSQAIEAVYHPAIGQVNNLEYQFHKLMMVYLLQITGHQFNSNKEKETALHCINISSQVLLRLTLEIRILLHKQGFTIENRKFHLPRKSTLTLIVKTITTIKLLIIKVESLTNVNLR